MPKHNTGHMPDDKYINNIGTVVASTSGNVKVVLHEIMNTSIHNDECRYLYGISCMTWNKSTYEQDAGPTSDRR